MLADKMRKHNARCWLVNTGWSGGKYGVGKRMSLKYTRKLIDGIHEGALDNAEFETTPVFNLAIPKAVPGIPTEILNPRNTWSNKQEFDTTLANLGKAFNKNFEKYASKAS
jgi:phosphoenolpyruvate carboxykinase (ATP)